MAELRLDKTNQLKLNNRIKIRFLSIIQTKKQNSSNRNERRKKRGLRKNVLKKNRRKRNVLKKNSGKKN